MQKSLMKILVDPISKLPLTLKEGELAEDGQIISGFLRNDEGRMYPIVNGIPRFVTTMEDDQNKTAESFGYKWKQKDSYGSEQFIRWYHEWLMERYGFTSTKAMNDFFMSKSRILEVGCGSGMSSRISLGGMGNDQEWVGVDISDSIDLAQERLRHIPNTHFIQADLLQLPFPDERFDVIFAEGVLHHTSSTEAALQSLVPLLVKHGEIMFYVYRKKGPIREFTDDYIREIVSPLDPAQAWEILRPLTKLGKALADLHVEVEVPEDIPYLGIKAGTHDIQRFVYWNFTKLYWNEKFTFEENHHVNFDWYHPQYAHRQTEDEVRNWCTGAGLSITHFDTQESGFTVRAVRE